MDRRTLDVAAEFCKLTGTRDLLEYLGLEEPVEPDVARTALKDRRKFMQGMQANPKYKQQALFLIKNFKVLDEVLTDPAAHAADMHHRAESAHLPVLEMTIKGVLTAGKLNRDQVDYLRRNAVELGVSPATFEQMLQRLAKEADVPLPGATPGGTVSDVDTEPRDHYGVLGVDRMAGLREIQAAYELRTRAVLEMSDRLKAADLQRQLDKALSALTARDNERPTGPPARERSSAEAHAFNPSIHKAPTAPPARMRSFAPGRQSASSVTKLPSASLNLPPRRSRLEILGEPVRHVNLSGRAPHRTEITVRNGGDEAMPGRVATDVPWIVATPSRLDPDAGEQQVRVLIQPNEMPSSSGTGVVTIQTDGGERASIVFHIQKSNTVGLFLAAAGVSAVVLGLIAVVVWLVSRPPSVPEVDTSGQGGLTITVDPTADEVRVNGKSVGSGDSVFVPQPPLGRVRVEASHPNFDTWSKEVVVHSGRPVIVPIELELKSRLGFVPTAELRKATLDQDVVQRIMAQRSRAMENCVQQSAGAQAGGTLAGKVRIHVGATGQAIGVEIEGDGSDDPEMLACLERQAAAVVLHPLRDGDYVTVGWKYEVGSGGAP